MLLRKRRRYTSATPSACRRDEFEKPEAVPFLPYLGEVVLNYGGLTPYEAMYDFAKYKQCYWKFAEDFGLEYTIFSGGFNSGKYSTFWR